MSNSHRPSFFHLINPRPALSRPGGGPLLAHDSPSNQRANVTNGAHIGSALPIRDASDLCRRRAEATHYLSAAWTYVGTPTAVRTPLGTEYLGGVYKPNASLYGSLEQPTLRFDRIEGAPNFGELSMRELASWRLDTICFRKSVLA
ncbi:hypothetical protein CROQUDRAFT_93835 [Cronartium quercuum f. sp. fusiforme G11]|uniref:Uncharacterized protein n=1 Tax=Cronartium quercuum f. sp. fusiforme G11 TaxID=708437 RepID=A0A9P6NER0_9BASI|nr:hypothetical protein CROQUDRAFT_93835 [Cronartium quercuum f. sp. fusiforme G11]